MIIPLSQREALNEERFIQLVRDEWKEVSFPLFMTRITSPIVENVNYIDLNMEKIDGIIRAEILEDRKSKDND